VLSLAVDAAEQPAIDVRGFFEGELAARRKLELGV
jgi:hypothetical protein